MDILKDIEKNILNINIYEKNIYSDKKDVLNKSNILKLDIIITKGNFLLDGFPRNQENIDSWNKKMAPYCSTEFLLFFDCDKQKMQERMEERSKTSGRSDDNPETIKKRLDTFEQQTKPIIDYFTKQKKVVRIDADGQIDEIFDRVSEQINNRIMNLTHKRPKVVFLSGGPGSGKVLYNQNMLN